MRSKHSSPFPPTRRREGAFTLVELLVVIGIIAVLISILLPSLNKARAAATFTKCLANQKQFVTSLILYCNDNKGVFPCGAQKVNGVNKYVDDSTASPLTALRVDPEIERRQVERVRALRARRNDAACQDALARVRAAASGTTNLVEPIVDALEHDATLGEISDALRTVFGEHAPA